MPFSVEFYKKPTIQVAKNLLGTFLAHESTQGMAVGRIVETEAYLYNDPSCHGFRGETPRNKPMFGPPGHAYIYFIYGMYHCFNVVTAPVGVGEAVLIRSLEPVEGIDLMQQRRQRTAIHELASGPGKLVIAMGLTREMNGANLITSPLKILPRESFPQKYPARKLPVVTTTRIGISSGNHLPLRFYLKDNPFISRK